MGLNVHQWIEEGKDLPVLSGSIAKIMSLTQHEDSNISKIAEVIKTDVGLSGAVLRVTNSSAFGLLKKITSIDQAVVLLGFQAIRNIAIAVGVVNLFPPSDKDFLSKTWQRSLVTGIASRELTCLNGKGKNEDAFTAGLLHDIGLIALYAFDGNKALEFLKQVEENGRMPLDKERRLMGMDHVEAGGLLAKKWNLPDDIVSAILHHHHHHDDPGGESACSGQINLSRIVYLGSLAGDIFYLGNKEKSLEEFNENCRELLGITDENIEELLHNIHPQLVEIAEHFDIAIGSDNTYEDILRELNEEMANITVSNEATRYHLTQAFKREKELANKLEEANRELRVLASKDSLTGLFNRQFLDELLEREWHKSKHYDYPLSVVMADIDDFKKVNDNYGHKVGDVVLKKIAEVLNKSLRKNDFLARYGGEEFAFVLPQTDLKDACKISLLFKQVVKKLRLRVIENNNQSLSISCGVSTAFPDRNGDSMEALLKRADDALYKAKRSGKDRVAFKKLAV